MDESNRDELALRQFGARCKCAQVYRRPYAQLQPSATSEQVYGRVDVDAQRWMHVGTSPVVSQKNVSNLRSVTQNNMKEGFCAGFYS